MLEYLRELQSTSQCLLSQAVSTVHAAAVWWPAAARPEQQRLAAQLRKVGQLKLSREPRHYWLPLQKLQTASRQTVARTICKQAQPAVDIPPPSNYYLPRQHPARANVSYSPGHNPPLCSISAHRDLPTCATDSSVSPPVRHPDMLPLYSQPSSDHSSTVMR